MPIRLPRIGRAQSPVGVEIGNDAVRMLQTTMPGSDRIRRVAVVPRSADGSIDVQRLRRAWRGFSSFDAVVSLDDDCVDVRPGRLPRLSGEELRDAARWEIAGMLERDGADLVAESMSVGRDVAEDGRVEMLLIAADRTTVEERLDPLLEVGIRPIAVEPVFLAAGRAFAMRSRRDDEQEVVRVVVKTDEATTWISVMRGDGVVFASVFRRASGVVPGVIRSATNESLGVPGATPSTPVSSSESESSQSSISSWSAMAPSRTDGARVSGRTRSFFNGILFL